MNVKFVINTKKLINGNFEIESTEYPAEMDEIESGQINSSRELASIVPWDSISACLSKEQRENYYMSIYNNEAISITATLHNDDEQPLFSYTLDVLEHVQKEYPEEFAEFKKKHKDVISQIPPKVKSKDAKIEAMGKMIEEGVMKMMNEPGEYMEYMKAVAKLPTYSFNNIMLLVSQKPDVTAVCGFDAWQKNFDRHVCKGEKGLMIYRPVERYTVEEVPAIDEFGIAIVNADGTQKMTEVKTPHLSFTVAYVWDVSQTEGKEFPTTEKFCKVLDGNVESFSEIMQVLQEVSPVPVNIKPISSMANGFFDVNANEITVKLGMSQEQTIKTTIHEIAHAICHSKGGTDPNASKEEKELTAESVAFIVCEHLGIDSSDYSIGYCASYSKDKDIKDLKKSMCIIKQTASDLIAKIDNKLAIELELSKEIPDFETPNNEPDIEKKKGIAI